MRIASPLLLLAVAVLVISQVFFGGGLERLGFVTVADKK